MPSCLNGSGWGVFGMQACVAEFAEVNTAFKEDVWKTPWVGLKCWATGQVFSLTGRRGCWEMFLNSPFTGPSHGAVISFPQTSVSCFQAGPVSPSPMPSLLSVIRLRSHPQSRWFWTPNRGLASYVQVFLLLKQNAHTWVFIKKEWYVLFKKFFLR